MPRGGPDGEAGGTCSHHLLWREDQGMMGQFPVVDPGLRPDYASRGDSDDHDH